MDRLVVPLKVSLLNYTACTLFGNSPFVEQLVSIDLLEVTEELLWGAGLGWWLEEVVVAKPHGYREVWQHSGRTRV